MIATGKYDRFLPTLISSARAHLMGLGTIFVLADRPFVTEDDAVRWLPWGHTPWPHSTLLRYRAITAYSAVLGDADILVHLDVDMRFVAPVEFPRDGLFAVAHPGYVAVSRSALPYETDPASRAFVPPESGTVYVAGAVQGGASAEYLSACAQLADDIQADLDLGLIPVWHDESMWNRFCAEHESVVVLPADYCTPESAISGSTRIVALDKPHAVLRGSSRRAGVEDAVRRRAPWLVRWLRPVARKARRITSGFSSAGE